jgi:hypothetical protein
VPDASGSNVLSFAVVAFSAPPIGLTLAVLLVIAGTTSCHPGLLFPMLTYMAFLPLHTLGLGMHAHVDTLLAFGDLHLIPSPLSLLTPLEVDSEPEKKPVLKPKPELKVATKVPKGDKDDPIRIEQKKMGRLMSVSL